LYVAGGVPVAVERRNNRPDLFVAGCHKERGCAPVRLGADCVAASLWVGEFVDAVRWDGSAGVLVGVDQRGERPGAPLQPNPPCLDVCQNKATLHPDLTSVKLDKCRSNCCLW
jgi:hypothetical protein